MKTFLLVSAGTQRRPLAWSETPYLNIIKHSKVVDEEMYGHKNEVEEFGCTEQCARAELKSHAWIPEEDWLPFIENAEVGDVILLKDIYLLFRLRDRC